MPYRVDVQIACQDKLPITTKILKKWVILALHDHIKAAELTLRLVDVAEICFLNNQYRHQNKPTNVLAFPSEIPDSIKLRYQLLGDVIICPAVLNQESLDQNKIPLLHWAHIVIHGVLHLLGFDHIHAAEAERMEIEEHRLLQILNHKDEVIK